MSDTETEPQTAMLLTDSEWRMLADICECYLAQAPSVDAAAPMHAHIARRVIRAARD